MSFSPLRASESVVRSVSPSLAMGWLVWGWRAFLRAPGPWALQALTLSLIVLAIAVVPLIGWAVVIVAFPVLVGGMLHAAAAQDQGQTLSLRMLFYGLGAFSAPLATVGACYLAGALIAGIIALGIGGSAALTGYLIGALAGFGLAMGGMVLAAVVFSVLWVILVMALWFAPVLVVLRGHTAHEAIRLSFQASLANLLPLSLLGLVLYVLAWVAMLPAGLGMLVLSPVVACALYRASTDVFADPAALPAHTEPPLAPDAGASFSKEP